MTSTDKLRSIISERFDNNQAAFGRAIERSPSQVNQWLSGYRKMDVKACHHIEKKLGLPPDYFMGNISYGAATSTMLEAREPTAHQRRLVQQVCEIAEQINDDGLRELIGFARCLIGTQPKIKAKRA